MALVDLSKYDLLDLILASSWHEEKQADTVLKFTYALAGFLGEELSKCFDEKADLEFQNLLKTPGLTEQQVKEFYSAKIPNFEETIDELTLKFKKMFLLKVYQNKIEELKKSLSGMEKAMEKEKTDVQTNLMRMIADELSIYEQILLYCQQDNWDKVWEIIQTLPH